MSSTGWPGSTTSRALISHDAMVRRAKRGAFHHKRARRADSLCLNVMVMAPSQLSVARAAATISERLSSDWNEFPVVATSTQGELHDAVAVAVHHFAVGDGCSDASETGPAGPHDELPESAREIEDAARRLRREALIVVIVPDDHELRVVFVQRRPERPGAAETAVLTRAEQRLVPIGERALLGVR